MANENVSSLGRVQRDLEIVQRALGEAYPFDRSMIAAWLGLAGISALGVITVITSSQTFRAITLLSCAALIVAVVALTLRIRQARAKVPFVWREVKTVSMAKLIAGPPLLAFMIWQFTQGITSQYLISTTAFWGGVVTLIYATTRPWRRVGFGVAIPLLAMGGIVPLIETQRIALAAAWTGIVAGASCASIITIQIRSHMKHTMG